MPLTIDLTPEQEERLNAVRQVGIDVEAYLLEALDALLKQRTPEAKKPVKELRGYGMFAGIGSVEEFLCQKRLDTARENRLL